MWNRRHDVGVSLSLVALRGVEPVSLAGVPPGALLCAPPHGCTPASLLEKAVAVVVPPKASLDWFWSWVCMFAVFGTASSPYASVRGCSCLANEGSS